MSGPLAEWMAEYPEPTTDTGRQHVAAFGVGQFGRVHRAVAAIEAEARAALLGELRAGVEGLVRHLERAAQDAHYAAHTDQSSAWRGCRTERCREVSADLAAVLALLDAASEGAAE